MQSADFYSLPITSEQVELFEKQFLELLLEESPFARSGSFATIEQAINAHETEFDDENP